MDSERVRPDNLEEVAVEMVQGITGEVIELTDEEEAIMEEVVKSEFSLVIDLISNRMDSIEVWDDIDKDDFEKIGQIAVGIGMSKARACRMVNEITGEGE